MHITIFTLKDISFLLPDKKGVIYDYVEHVDQILPHTDFILNLIPAQYNPTENVNKDWERVVTLTKNISLYAYAHSLPYYHFECEDYFLNSKSIVHLHPQDTKIPSNWREELVRYINTLTSVYVSNTDPGDEQALKVNDLDEELSKAIESTIGQSIREETKAKILEGIKDIEEGRTFSMEEVREEILEKHKRKKKDTGV